METRSKARAGRSQVPSEGVLEDPEPWPPTGVDEDSGLSSLMGHGEVPIVGGGQPEVGVSTSTSGDIPVAMEWAPAREPVVESPRPQPTLVLTDAAAAREATASSMPTLVGTATDSIPTLSCPIPTPYLRACTESRECDRKTKTSATNQKSNWNLKVICLNYQTVQLTLTVLETLTFFRNVIYNLTSKQH